MDGINIVLQAQLNQRRNIQIRLNRLTRIANLIRFICFETVKCITVLMRVNGNGAETKFGGASKHSNGDFASVGNKQLFDRFHIYLSKQSTGDKGLGTIADGHLRNEN